MVSKNRYDPVWWYPDGTMMPSLLTNDDGWNAPPIVPVTLLKFGVAPPVITTDFKEVYVEDGVVPDASIFALRITKLLPDDALSVQRALLPDTLTIVHEFATACADAIVNIPLDGVPELSTIFVKYQLPAVAEATNILVLLMATQSLLLTVIVLKNPTTLSVGVVPLTEISPIRPVIYSNITAIRPVPIIIVFIFEPESIDDVTCVPAVIVLPDTESVLTTNADVE